MASVFEDEFVPNIQSANKTSYGQWKQSNPKEAQKWEAYRDAAIAHKKGQPAPSAPTLATKYGKALVAAGKQHVSVTDLGSTYEPPELPPDPPAGPVNPYYSVNFAAQGYQPLSTVFQAYTSAIDSHIESWGGNNAAFYDTGLSDRGIILARDPAMRVSLRTTPAPPRIGSSYVSRQEVRTSDPPWYPGAGANYDKSSVRNLNDNVTFNQNFAQGLTRWFAYDYFLPNNFNGDTFNWPNGGWHTLMDLHGSGSNFEQNWNVLESMIRPLSTANVYHAYHMGAHEGASDPAPADTEYCNLLQLTNSSGVRIASAFNTWHELVVGVKFASDGVINSSTGWIDIWHDGVNVLPQHFRPTCFTNESEVWLQMQNYKQHSNAFVGGATSSVIYYGGLRAGYIKSDVSYH